MVVGGANLTSTTSPGLTFAGTGNVTVAGTIANGVQSTGNLNYSGQGTFLILGNNTYTGATTFSNTGTVKLGSTSALGSTTSVSVSGGSTLDLNGLTYVTPIPITGTGAANSGLLGTLTNSSATPASYTGNMTTVGTTNLSGTGDITLTGVLTGGAGVALNKITSTPSLLAEAPPTPISARM